MKQLHNVKKTIKVYNAYKKLFSPSLFFLKRHLKRHKLIKHYLNSTFTVTVKVSLFDLSELLNCREHFGSRNFLKVGCF